MVVLIVAANCFWGDILAQLSPVLEILSFFWSSPAGADVGTKGKQPHPVIPRLRLQQ